jgi:UDP-N-acetylglucosamine--N-acetylmuramyl-(pentapeptide) pyrophosphoryl-undecaprenol N-acetylglucosamine transferase
VSAAALPGNLVRLVRGYFAARGILRRRRPDVIFLTGGYVSVPVALAARKVPQLAFVPDLEPGVALKALGLTSRVIALSADETRRFFRKHPRVRVTGYPVRPELQPVERGEARARMALHPRDEILLVMGGSRGARAINEALWQCLEKVLGFAEVVHLTGNLDFPRVASIRLGLPPRLAERYHAFSYLHEELAWALSAANLALSRAGASTLGEYPLFGLPAVLVPYPHAWRYQIRNADYLERHGAAVILRERDLARRLSDTVVELLRDPARLEHMGERARSLAVPGAAHAIAAELENLARRPAARND